MEVVQVCPACGNQLFTNPDGERQIGHPVPVQMTDLSLPDLEEDHPTSMRFDGDPRPRGHCTPNLNGNRLRQHHSIMGFFRALSIDNVREGRRLDNCLTFVSIRV